MQTIVRACEKTAARTKPWKSWDHVASGPQKTHNMTTQQMQAQLGNQWYVVRTAAGGSHNPELGQAHRARMNHHSTQLATDGQAGSSSLQAQWPRKFSVLLRTRPRILRSERGM